MKTAINTFVVLGIAISCGAATEVRSATDKPDARTLRFEATQGSIVRIKGTSQLHDWEVRGSTISGFMIVGDNFPAQLLQSVFPDKIVAHAEVSIPVSDLKCDGPMFGPRADAVMMAEALKSRQYPEIHYRLNELLVLKGITTNGVARIFNSKGELVIAGITNSVVVPLSVTPVGEKKFKLSGRTSVKMTDFGITRPAIKGADFTLTVGDEVEISFEWIVVESPSR